jgi:hypothetical protein
VVCNRAAGPSPAGRLPGARLTQYHPPAAPAGSFRGRSADFLWMLLFGGTLLTCIAPFVNIQFLGSSLTFMMVYVWGRRHQ